jgi:hypothetical protein
VAGPDGNIDFLAASLERSLSDLRRGVDGLEGANDPGESQFLTYLRAAIEGIEARRSALVSESAGTTDAIDRASIETQLRRLHQWIKVLHLQTGPVIGLRTPGLGLGVVYFVREAARSIIGPDAVLIVRPDTEHTYSTLGEHRVFERVLSSVHIGLPPGEPPVLIQYPWVERASVALHALFLHELAHEAVQRHSLVSKVWDGHPDPAGLDTRFAQVIGRIVAAEASAGRTATAEDIEAKIRAQLERWIEELLCDAIASAYAGPSFLLAFVAFLGAGDPHGSSTNHPAFANRVRLNLALLGELEWTPLMSAKVPTITKWVQGLASRTAWPASDERGAFVASVIDEIAPAIREVSRAHLGDAVFTPAAYQGAGDDVEDLVRESVPPVQLKTREPVSRRDMFLGAWLGTLQQLGDRPESIPMAVAHPALQALHGQAIELSFLLEAWAEP